jgi:hypothetical protein
MEKTLCRVSWTLAHGKESLSCVAQSWYTAKTNYFQPTPPPAHEFHPGPFSPPAQPNSTLELFKHRPLSPPCGRRRLSPFPDSTSRPHAAAPHRRPELPAAGGGGPSSRSWEVTGGGGLSIPFLDGGRRRGLSPSSTLPQRPTSPPQIPPRPALPSPPSLVDSDDGERRRCPSSFPLPHQRQRNTTTTAGGLLPHRQRVRGRIRLV